MRSSELLTDAFERIQEVVHHAVEGLTQVELSWRPDPESNSIAWLVWHLTRIQDDHVAGIAGSEQVWTQGGWVDKFHLPFDVSATGYGHTPQEAGLVHVPSESLLLDYHDAVHDETMPYVAALEDAHLDRIVDTRWDPPVTLGKRLVSVISDDLQHAGQAMYVRGLLERQ